MAVITDTVSTAANVSPSSTVSPFDTYHFVISTSEGRDNSMASSSTRVPVPGSTVLMSPRVAVSVYVVLSVSVPLVVV